MPSNITAQAIVFAINSAIRLGRNVQKAYANSLKSKAILLPLPSFDKTPNTFSISRFFDTQGQQFAEDIEVLKYLHRKNKMENLTPEELAEYREYYRTLYYMTTKGETDPAIKQAGLSTDDVVNLLKIRQWEEDKKFATTTLQLVAGTVVEIGIDYFNQFPGALNENSSFGKALKRFLEAMDTIPFSEEESFKKALSEKVLPRLFITAAETLQEIDTDLVRDEKLQQFIAATSKGITEDLYQLIGPDMSIDEAEQAIQWGQILLSSMIKNAGYYIFSDPSLTFNIAEGQEKLIQQTGLALLELLYQKDEFRIDLKALLNIEAIDSIIRASFVVLAEYPGLLARKDSVKALIKDIILTVLDTGFPLPEILPELIRIIIHKTATHLDKLWDYDEQAPEHLLVIALRQILESLSISTEDGTTLKQAFSKSQLVELINDLFDEVIRHPAWITRRINGQDLLKEAIEASFKALEHLPKEERLSYEVFRMLLELNLRMIASSPRILEKIQLGTEETQISILNKVLDYAFDFIFRREQSTYMERKEALRQLLDEIVSTILIRYPNQKGLLLLELLLSKESGLNLSNEMPLSVIKRIGELLLDFLILYPEQFAKEEGIQDILVNFAKVLKAYGLDHPGTLPQLLAILLNQMSDNLDQVIITEEGQPEYLIVLALREIFDALDLKNTGVDWRPRIHSGQLIEIIDLLLDEVLRHPEWVLSKVEERTILAEAVDISFRALKSIPKANRLSVYTLVELLEINMRAIARNPKVLEKIEWTEDEDEAMVLEKAIDLIMSYIYEQDELFSLNRSETALEILDYIIRVILSRHPDRFGLELIHFIISGPSGLDIFHDWNELKADEVVGQLLLIISRRPEWISDQPNIQDVIAGVAADLSHAGLRQPGLLQEVLRLTLLYSGEELERLFYDEPEPSLRTYLVRALVEFIDAITVRPDEGKWVPDLSADQIIELVLFVLEEVREHPDWVRSQNRVYQTLTAIFRAFDFIPNDRKLLFSLIKLILIKIFEAVRKHPQQLLEITISEQGRDTMVLFYILKELLKGIHEEVVSPGAIKMIQQRSVIDALLDYFLYRITSAPIDKASIDALAHQVRLSMKDLEAGRITEEKDFIDALRNNLIQ